MRPVTFYLKRPVEDDPIQSGKVNEIKDKLQGFVHDSALIAANGVNPEYGVRDAYSQIARMIDTDVYMRWLMDQSVRRLPRRVSKNRGNPERPRARASGAVSS